MNTNTHIKLRNGKSRARPGMGKTPWGIDPARTNQIESQIACPQYQLKLKFHHLYEATKATFSLGQEYARAGRKDIARRLFYTLERGGLAALLQSEAILEISGISGEKIAALKQAEWDFQTSCHPEEPATYELEIHEIRDCLREIVNHLPVKKRKAAIKAPTVTVTRTMPSSPATFSLRQANRHFAETAYRNKFRKGNRK